MPAQFLPKISADAFKEKQASPDADDLYELLVTPLHEELYKRQTFAFFDELSPGQQLALCTDLAASKPKPELKKGAAFFKRFRDLTAGGYYTTPEGMKAIGYVGNVPSGSFEGPPIEALKHVGLA